MENSILREEMEGGGEKREGGLGVYTPKHHRYHSFFPVPTLIHPSFTPTKRGFDPKKHTHTVIMEMMDELAEKHLIQCVLFSVFRLRPLFSSRHHFDRIRDLKYSDRLTWLFATIPRNSARAQIRDFSARRSFPPPGLLWASRR